MPSSDFHDQKYDAATLTKLRIFELYSQEWIPVFLSQPQPKFGEIHIFDFFAGPGTDAAGAPGSPLRILGQLRGYQQRGLAGWDKARIEAHFFDESAEKIEQLRVTLQRPEWRIPGVHIDCRQIAFQDSLAEHRALLSNPRMAKLLIIDQYGVDEVSDAVFKKLIDFPTADFIFFLSSSTLHRFRDHPAIKQKIEMVEDSYDVHRAAVAYYRKLIPCGDKVFLGPFSIKKQHGNIYGLIFGSRHPLGIHKFLQVAWASDEISGEANFDIERENIRPKEGILAFDIMRPTKIREFEEDLERALRAGEMKTEADVVRLCIEAGMTCRHSALVLKRLKAGRIIDLNFRVPNVDRMKDPRPIRLI
ncbi:MAG TPA: three-Cys-motif partner protein TcmP [Verrucomicrobiae bacterium]|jgi:three-Cys-motif partner protein